MKIFLLPRNTSQNILHLRNTSPNLGKRIMNILEDLGKVMNAMKNNVKFLGKHQDNMRILRVSLNLLDEWLNK